MKRTPAFGLVLTVLGLLLTGPSAVAGTPGALDAQFGDRGLVSFAKAGPYSNVVEMIVQPSGRIVLAANRDGNTTSSSPGMLYSRTPLGTADASFGVAGMRGVSVDAALLDMAVASSGRILVLDAKSKLHAFDQNGQADTLFGSSGLLDVANLAGGCRPKAVAVQRIGRILLAGTAAKSRPCILGLDPSGSVDSSFGENGVRVFDQSSSVAGHRTGFAVTSDDSVLLGVIGAPGAARPGTSLQVSGVVKFTPNGQLDVAFGNQGLASKPAFATNNFSYYGEVGVSVILPLPSGGAIVTSVEGRVSACTRGCGYQSQTYRLDELGSAFKRVAGGDFSNGLAAAPGGRFVASQNEYFHTMVSRWHESGAPDLSFDENGFNTFNEPGADSVQAVATDAAGDVYVAGTDSDGSVDASPQSRLFVARFLGTSQGISAPQVDPGRGFNAPHKRGASVAVDGGARPAGEIRRIFIAVQRSTYDLARHHRCQWLRGPRGGYVTRKLRKGVCRNPVYFRAKGAAKWRVTLRPRWRYGRHTLYAQPAMSTKRANGLRRDRYLLDRFVVSHAVGD